MTNAETPSNDMSTIRVVSVSGGKDSTALYCWAIEQFGRDGFRAVFADTGHEHPVTLNYLRNMAQMAGGPEITWVKADFSEKLRVKGKWPSENPFLDMWRHKGRAPSSQAQFCTEQLKLKPIQVWIEKIRGDAEVIMYTGIRAGESLRRSKMPEREWAPLYDCYTERPLLKWTQEQVFAFLKAKGVPPNPLYENGSSRVGCYPCIHARKSELASLPDWAWEKLAVWEKLAGSTWFSFGEIPLTPHQEQELAEIKRAVVAERKLMAHDAMAGIPVDASAKERLADWKNRNSPTVEQVREWAKTTRGGRQFNMFAEDAKDVPTCMSTWGQCE